MLIRREQFHNIQSIEIDDYCGHISGENDDVKIIGASRPLKEADLSMSGWSHIFPNRGLRDGNHASDRHDAERI